LTKHQVGRTAVWGALIGDAAGATLEMIVRKPERAKVLHALKKVGGGCWRTAPGQITDDGEMVWSTRPARTTGSPSPTRRASTLRRCTAWRSGTWCSTLGMVRAPLKQPGGRQSGWAMLKCGSGSILRKSTRMWAIIPRRGSSSTVSFMPSAI